MYEKISSTAESIAYVRGYTKVPYAKVIALLIDAEKETLDFYHRDDFEIDLARLRKLGPWAALRTNALDRALVHEGAHNIIEIASGFSPMGLMWSEKKYVRYVETDLPEILSRKKDLVEHIFGALINKRTNLQFAPLNIFEPGALERIKSTYFGNVGLTVVNEGLLQYLTHEEKARVAQTIYNMLSLHGGAWITPDIVLRSHFQAAFATTDYTERVQRIITENTGRDMTELAFETYADARALFHNCGFTISEHKQLDLAGDMFPGRVLKARPNLVHQVVWVMRPKGR